MQPSPKYISFYSNSYLVGGRLLNIFTEFYLLDDDSDSNDSTAAVASVSMDSPKWIGAWWLGFLLILVLSYLCAILMVRAAKFWSFRCCSSKSVYGHIWPDMFWFFWTRNMSVYVDSRTFELPICDRNLWMSAPCKVLQCKTRKKSFLIFAFFRWN